MFLSAYNLREYLCILKLKLINVNKLNKKTYYKVHTKYEFYFD